MKCMPRVRVTSALLGLSGLLLAAFAAPINAQPASALKSGHGFGFGYDATHEVTINGTVQEVVTKHALGSPAGIHLLVAVPLGMVDAHVGPFLAKDAREALHTGLPIQIVGAVQVLHGRQYLLARQLPFDGRAVTVRNPRGFLLRSFSTRRATFRPGLTTSGSNGGAR